MVERFGVSMEKDLLARFDAWCGRHNYKNRSEAIRDLVRGALVEEEWEKGGADATAVLFLVYEHHFSELGSRLDEFQHEHFRSIVSTLHVHLDHDNCLEVVILRGKARDLRNIGDTLLAQRGVKHGRLVPAITRQGL